SALRGPKFAEQLWTDDLTVAQVADHIAASASLALNATTDCPIRDRLRRAWIGAKHVRFD
ncbi:MAG: ATP-binding protein, partial [Pseudonocardiaceae bacterium]